MSESQTGTRSGIRQHMKRVLATGERSDIQFAVGHQYGKEELFQAHKFTLSISSDVFDAMFYGDIRQPTEKTIKLPDILPQAFRIMLKYIYTDVVEDLGMETALPTLHCAQKYSLPELVDICAAYAIQNVSQSTCLTVLESAKALAAEKVVRKCLSVLDIHCSQVFRSNGFLQLKRETLQLILQRDTLRITEVDVYTAAKRWAANACRINHREPTGASYRRMLGHALFLIRFPLMDDGLLVNDPLAIGLLREDEAFKIYQFRHAVRKPDIPFSGTPRRPPNISFCGLQWIVRDSSSTGNFTGMTRPDNVFLDEHGHLHLRLSQHNGIWKGAEIRSVDALGFGLYEFHIQVQLDRLDPNVIFTLGSQTGKRSSIDIAFAKWGVERDGGARYGVTRQQASAAFGGDNASIHDFAFALKGNRSTHAYAWESANVFFRSDARQADTPWVGRGRGTFDWAADGTTFVPQEALPVAIHLSSYLGKAPSDGKEVEIIVHSFRFRPAE